MVILDKGLNIGCGPQSRWIPDTDGVDMQDFGQKYVGDILTLDIPDQYGFIYCHHLVEHIQDTNALMDKLGSLLPKDGLLDIRVPIFPYPQCFQDPTHVKFIPGAVFFQYYTKDSPAGHCYSKTEFEIVSIDRERIEWELHIVLRKL